MPSYAARPRRGVAVPDVDVQIPLEPSTLSAAATAGGGATVTVLLAVAATAGGNATVTVSPPIVASASAGGGATTDTTPSLPVDASAGGGATVTVGSLVTASAGGGAAAAIALVVAVSGGGQTATISWQTEFPAEEAPDLPADLTDPADFDEPEVLQTTFVMPDPVTFYNGVPVDWEPEVP